MEDGGNGFPDESIDVFVGGLTAARIEFLGYHTFECRLGNNVPSNFDTVAHGFYIGPSREEVVLDIRFFLGIRGGQRDRTPAFGPEVTGPQQKPVRFSRAQQGKPGLRSGETDPEKAEGRGCPAPVCF